MSREYSMKAFLRRAPNDFVRQFLERLGIGNDVPWAALAATDIGRICKAIEKAGEDERRAIDATFRQIDEMGDEGATKTLIDEGRDPHHNVDLTQEFEKLDSHVGRAFWAFLHYPQVFAVAQKFHYADNLGRWRKRPGLPVADAAVEPEDVHRLEKGISEYYVTKEGRGHACHVDHYQRGRDLYWFAYPEGYAENRMVYDNHQLKVQSERPAFEVLFIYSPDERSLDTYVRGSGQTLADLQAVFGRAILNVDLNRAPKPGITYALDSLLDRDFPFDLQPQDGIESVRVRSLRLQIMGSNVRRITLEAPGKCESRAIYHLLDDVLAGERINRDLLMVSQAKLQVTFRSMGNERKPTLTFEVTHPNSCSLRSDPKHDVVKACLKRWNIDVSGRDGNGPAVGGLPAQYLIPR